MQRQIVGKVLGGRDEQRAFDFLASTLSRSIEELQVLVEQKGLTGRLEVELTLLRHYAESALESRSPQELKEAVKFSWQVRKSIL